MELTASTLKRPTAKQLARFRIEDAGQDTVGLYLARGWSLAICCRACPRLAEWTPPELEQRFGDRLDARIADIGAWLSCRGDGGCGSRDVAVFPHAYDGSWPAS